MIFTRLIFLIKRSNIQYALKINMHFPSSEEPEYNNISDVHKYLYKYKQGGKIIEKLTEKN